MPSDFDDRVLSLLTSLPAHDAEESVSKLESALRIPGSVRNPSAYLAGVIKRLSGAGSGPPGGPGGRAGELPPPAAPAQLAPAAGSVLEQLIAEGRMRPGDLEGRNLANVAALPPEMQLFIMRTFADRNLHGIRNMAGQAGGVGRHWLLACVVWLRGGEDVGWLTFILSATLFVFASTAFVGTGRLLACWALSGSSAAGTAWKPGSAQHHSTPLLSSGSLHSTTCASMGARGSYPSHVAYAPHVVIMHDRGRLRNICLSFNLTASLLLLL
jgi:hypothetical protein